MNSVAADTIRRASWSIRSTIPASVLQLRPRAVAWRMKSAATIAG